MHRRYIFFTLIGLLGPITLLYSSIGISQQRTRPVAELRAKLEELIDAVEHHVEEEESELFPQIREVFDEDELEQLGQELESAKGTAHRKAS